jgi:cell division protease FtsH
MIEEAYVRTKAILAANKDKLALLAKKLLEKEVIYKDDLEAIFGERSFGQKSRVDTLMEENEEAQAKEKKADKKSDTKANVTEDSPESEDKKASEEEKATPEEENAG